MVNIKYRKITIYFAQNSNCNRYFGFVKFVFKRFHYTDSCSDFCSVCLGYKRVFPIIFETTRLNNTL